MIRFVWVVVVVSGVVGAAWLAADLPLTKSLVAGAAVGIAAGTVGLAVEHFVEDWRRPWV